MSIQPKHAEQLYNESIETGEAKGEKTLIFYLKDALNDKLELLQKSFPDSAFHTVAIKTQSHPQVLKHIVAKGFGLEAASFEEVELAKQAGAANEHIVFDSPVKTRHEIEQCHKNFPGITLNANSIQELERYPSDFSGNLGLRVNPREKSDAPEIFNLAGLDSKFGVPISQRNEIINACLKHKTINGLHVHIGSGIKNFQNNVSAVTKLKALADEINSLREAENNKRRIEYIDIGGGIQFNNELEEFSTSAFVRQLKTINGLFEHYKIITEYGSFVHKNNSFVVSDVEYVIPKPAPFPSLIYVHVGADLFVRKVYSSLPIHYPVHVIQQNSSNKLAAYRIVGPLCFEGDILYENITLRQVNEGDKIMFLNTGANTLSMWSGHCNRSLPKFIFK